MIIYLLGVLACIVLEYIIVKQEIEEDEDASFTLSNIALAILFAAFSWLSFILLVFIEFSDKIIKTKIK